jgi:site-specific recombinase
MWETHEQFDPVPLPCRTCLLDRELLAEQTDALENALWAAIGHWKAAALLGRLASFLNKRGNHLAAERFRKLSPTPNERADIIRQIVQKNGDIELESGIKQDDLTEQE